MGLESVPIELRSFRQFVVWKYETIWGSTEQTKVPYNPVTLQKASSIDPNSWCDYNTCMAAIATGAWSGLGFVLSENDEFAFIDLDYSTDPEILARQKLIFDQFDSYSERSPSGTGLHIIVRGKIPQGRKRGSIEIYSSKRFMTLTGDVYNPKPIANRQELLTALYNEMRSEEHTSELQSL